MKDGDGPLTSSLLGASPVEASPGADFSQGIALCQCDAVSVARHARLAQWAQVDSWMARRSHIMPESKERWPDGRRQAPGKPIRPSVLS